MSYEGEEVPRKPFGCTWTPTQWGYRITVHCYGDTAEEVVQRNKEVLEKSEEVLTKELKKPLAPMGESLPRKSNNKGEEKDVRTV